MLKDKAHIKLGSYTFQLDEGTPDHYAHLYTPMFKPGQSIPGTNNSLNLRPEKLMWTMTDWAGGEGNRFWTPDDPFVYSKAYGVNPRIRGEITGRPNRDRCTVATNDQRDRGFMDIADSAVWVAQSRDLIAYATTDATSFTTKSQANVGLNSLSSSYRISSVAGHFDGLYYAAWHSGSSGSRTIRKIAQSGGSSSVVDEATGKSPYPGMAIFNGRLYAWTGRALWEHNIAAGTSLSGANITKVADTGADPPSLGGYNGSWWADCVATERGVVFFYSQDGQSQLWEFNHTSGWEPMWNPPQGFTLKAVAYQNGIVYASGHFGLDNHSGFGALYGIRLTTGEEFFVGYFRKHEGSSGALGMACVRQGPGNEVMAAAVRTGRIFIYDADMDAISCLDELANTGTDPDSLTFLTADNRISDLCYWNGQRLALIYRPSAGAAGTAVQVASYDNDEPDFREQAWNTSSFDGLNPVLEMGNWDYDLPTERKLFHGFAVAWQPLVSNQTIQLWYQIEDSGSWVSAGTITSAHADNDKGRTFLRVSDESSQVKFFNLKWKIGLTSTSTARPPIVYMVTAEAQLMAYEETWQLTLRLKDEQTHQRPSVRQVDSDKLRDWLLTTKEAKNPIAMQDGYRWKEDHGPSATPGYTPYTVVIEDVVDSIDRNAEGTVKVTLRKVPT